MNAHQWDARQKSIREQHHKLMTKVFNQTATEDDLAALSYLQQSLLALLPMVTARVFEAAMRNAELNSLIREPKDEL